MKGSELIDVVKSLMVDDRSDQISGPPDELAEPILLARLITQAQLEFCQYTGALVSSGPVDAVDEITLVVGTSKYAYSPAVVSVTSARLGDSNQALAKASMAQFETPTQHYDSGAPWVPTETAANVNSRPVAYALDAGTRSIVLNAAPSTEVVTSAGKLYLRVIRFPVADVTVATLEQELSIPREAHYGLAYWVAAEILSAPNVDRANARAAGEYRKRWSEYLVRQRAARIQRESAPVKFRFNAFGPR